MASSGLDPEAKRIKHIRIKAEIRKANIMKSKLLPY
jgi:hypothetical protein